MHRGIMLYFYMKIFLINVAIYLDWVKYEDIKQKKITDGTILMIDQFLRRHHQFVIFIHMSFFTSIFPIRLLYYGIIKQQHL